MVADRRESVALVSPHRATFRKVVSLFFSAGVGQLLSPGPLPPEKAKGNFETQRLGNLCLGLAHALVGMMQAARFFFCHFLLLLSPRGKLDRLAAAAAGWGCILPQGPGALTPGKTWIGWMDGRGTDWVVFGWSVGVCWSWSSCLSGLTTLVLMAH